MRTQGLYILVRDGRDVVCSYREVMSTKYTSLYAPNLETGIDDIASSWLSNAMKVDAFMSMVSAKNALTIRYEDIVTTPSTIIMSICEGLNISFEKNMLDFYQNNRRDKLEPDLTLGWKKRTLRPISNDTVGRYTRMLSKMEQAKFLKVAKNGLQRFSYI